jgi:hypothetical protein
MVWSGGKLFGKLSYREKLASVAPMASIASFARQRSFPL